MSVNTDPASDSAHRFLADTYAALPRHDTARVSELLQSQLLQPINALPIQPQLGLNNSFIFSRTGPADPGFSEWNSLFTRNGFLVLANGLVGGNDTYGDQIVVTGIWDRLSVSIGQFHYQTDGFRPNNDLEENIYQIFAQFQLSPRTSVQAEYRRRENEQGDLPLRFNPDDFDPTLRQTFDSDSARLGVRQVLSPSSTLIGSFIYEDDRTTTDVLDTRILVDQTGYHAEGQYLYRSKRWSLVAGGGYFSADGTDSTIGDFETRHGNAYLYPQLHLPWNLDLTLGVSVDTLSSSLRDTTQFNPKLGAIWNPGPRNHLPGRGLPDAGEAALLRAVDRADPGGGLQPALRRRGARRRLLALRRGLGPAAPGLRVRRASRHPGATRRSRSRPSTWTRKSPARRRPTGRRSSSAPTPTGPSTDWIALSAQYLYERLERDAESTGVTRVVESDTHRVPLSVAFFHPTGLQARLTGTYVNQSGRFGDAISGITSGSDQFWVLDASIGYRLPKRFGLITLEGRNLLDHRFRYNDNDFGHPTLYPERLILLRLTLAF